MSGDERESPDLAFRWLTVDEVLGRSAAWGATVSAGEYSAPALVGGGGGGQRGASELVAADAAAASRYFTADAAPGRLAGRTVLLPFPAVAELATWPERLLWGHSRTEELCEWLDSGRLLPGDETVARIWGRIMVAAQRTGGTPPVNDAWVAAACLSYGVPLATPHKARYRHFADRYGLKLI